MQKTYKIDKLPQIRSNNLVRIDEQNLFYVERKHDVKEQDLVAPNDPLFLLLLVQPSGPLVLHVLVVEPVPSRIFRQEFFQGWRQVVLQDPELDGRSKKDMLMLNTVERLVYA